MEQRVCVSAYVCTVLSPPSSNLSHFSPPLFPLLAQQPHIVASSSTPPYPDELAAASARVRDGLSAVQGAASAALGDASVAFSSALTKARDAKLETRNLVKWNFGVQAFLAAVSWAVVFTTTHADLMRGGVKGFPQLPTVLLLVGVVLSGVSAFWSFTYLRKVESSGESVLDGFAQLKNYFDHAQVNFLGAAATIIALQVCCAQGGCCACMFCTRTDRAHRQKWAPCLQRR